MIDNKKVKYLFMSLFILLACYAGMSFALRIAKWTFDLLGFIITLVPLSLLYGFVCKSDKYNYYIPTKFIRVAVVLNILLMITESIFMITGGNIFIGSLSLLLTLYLGFLVYKHAKQDN